MNLCNFAQVIISRCTKDASTINWRNENACSSDDVKLDIPVHSQLFTTQTRHTLYHTFMGKYPKMQISFEKFKYKLPRIQKYITNSKYWKHSNTNGEKMEFNWLYSLRSWFKLPEHYKKQHQIEDCDKCQSIISNAILHTRSASEGTTELYEVCTSFFEKLRSTYPSTSQNSNKRAEQVLSVL